MCSKEGNYLCGLCEACCSSSLNCFPCASRQDLQEEEVHSNEKGQQVSSRAFRCGYEGCGRLYTTAHHLKVKMHADQRHRRVTVPDQHAATQKAELRAWLPERSRGVTWPR